MFHKTVLLVAFGIFGLGMAWKISGWFRYSVGPPGSESSPSVRIAGALKGLAHTLFSRKLFTVIRVFMVEAVCQAKLLREDSIRWLMHVSIYSGFTILVVLHAFDNYLVAPLYSGYASTLNPFLFIRDIAGLLVVFGVALAVYGRFIRKVRRPITSTMDIYAIAIVGLIMLSGFLLEGMKIASPAAFQRMAAEYTVMADEKDIEALRSYWVENYGLAAQGLEGPFDPATLKEGESLNEMNCVQCHSSPKWGIGGYVVSMVFKPAASWLDRVDLPSASQWVHFLATLLFLAYLPFSKMFHIIAGPLSLMINSVMDGESNPANVATRQVIELDACTHCGACTLRCSVAVAANEIPNVNILPSEKMASLKRLAFGKQLSDSDLRCIQQGVFLCTNCDRCSVVCPVGIQLRDLWFNARERLLRNSIPEYRLLSPLAFYRGLHREAIDEGFYRKPLELAIDGIAGEPVTEGLDGTPLTLGARDFSGDLYESVQAGSFAGCYSCSTCTNSCPVVHNHERPGEVLGLLPHQLMYAIRLRSWDLVFNSKMLWDCLGCYQCQDNCPQSVAVTDIIYELKNRAVARKSNELSS